MPSVPSSKDLVQMLFELFDDENGKWRCQICKKTRTQDVSKEYTNLIDHLGRDHNKETILDAFNKVQQLDWIIIEKCELSMCEKQRTRLNTKLPKTYTKTLKPYMMFLAKVVQAAIACKLTQKKVGILFDCCTNTDSGYHFIAFFAVCPPSDKTSTERTRETYQPAFEAMETSDFDANAVIDCLDDVLDKYGIELQQLCFLVGDNANVSVSMAKKIDLPLIGCDSHRLNLAAETHIDANKNVIDKISELMRFLRTTKRRSYLCHLDCLMPNLRNQTRWSSCFMVIERHFHFTPHLDETDHELAPYIPSAAQTIEVTKVLKT